MRGWSFPKAIRRETESLPYARYCYRGFMLFIKDMLTLSSLYLFHRQQGLLWMCTLIKSYWLDV
jgi:hypothetical protein